MKRMSEFFRGLEDKAQLAYKKLSTNVRQVEVKADELVDRASELIEQGKLRRIVIKKDGEVKASFPFYGGVAAAVLAPYLTGIAGMVALATDCTIVLEKEE